MILVYFLVVFFGLCVGSFLNVLIYRLPRNLPFVRGRSYCPKCRKSILWRDNIPLLSFLFLKGRCRWCKKTISWRYPLVELLTGVLFVFGTESVLGRFGELGILGIIEIARVWILVSALVAIFFIDLKFQIVPDQIVFPVILISFIFSLITNHQPPTTSHQPLVTNLFPSAIISSAFFYLLYRLTKGKGMGFGDVKLVFLIGFSLGFPKVIIGLYSAFLTGAVVGVILILLGKAKFGEKIAFAPFLVVGWLAAYFWGDKIIWLTERFL